MTTKLDRQREQLTERAKRAGNLEALNKQLEEARDLLSVIPAGQGFETDRERQTVSSTIRELSELIADEQRAYDATFEDDQKAASAVEIMGLRKGI